MMNAREHVMAMRVQVRREGEKRETLLLHPVSVIQVR